MKISGIEINPIANDEDSESEGAFKTIMLLSERHYKAGYIIREEFIDDRDYGGNGLFIKNAYTPSGDWIGEPEIAYFLCKKQGIAPEKSKPKHCVCSIGFSEKDGKYYGWSHRALCGFAIGDKIFQARFGNDNAPFIKHGKQTIRNRLDQRKAAIAFANYID